VFLDSIMHSDMQPFAPWSAGNPQLHAITVDALQLFCMLNAVAGALVLGLLFRRAQKIGA
jgi:hypothetical protein